MGLGLRNQVWRLLGGDLALWELAVGVHLVCEWVWVDLIELRAILSVETFALGSFNPCRSASVITLVSKNH